ncbi:hypothetical protein HMPREF9238_00887 [Gleimia europaea ACS-120-V-Col10b]|uniref:Uncharacterized protein n=1 Tax=Gleimia europaea ACS-120-V-Col10b TaxID=883069 RepID=A0A9W5REZ3_9ACTO|nr:hypothetical protein HMPREF9238_00887 [Gleimia europaea ACS-120-V-Col10b]
MQDAKDLRGGNGEDNAGFQVDTSVFYRWTLSQKLAKS